VQQWDMSDAPVVHIDPPSFWTDPYPVLAEMRARTPICFVPELNATLLTKRDDIHTCEKNVAVFSSDQPGGLMNELMGRNMMRADGDEHRTQRFVYYPAISPGKVKAVWAAEFERLAQQTLDELIANNGNGADLVSTFATSMSGECLKVMTGLTNITAHQMDRFSQDMIDGISNYAGDPEVEARCVAATDGLDAAVAERLEAVRAMPDHSLLSVMDRAGMSEQQVRANIKLTVSGGQNEPRDASVPDVRFGQSRRRPLRQPRSVRHHAGQPQDADVRRRPAFLRRCSCLPLDGGRHRPAPVVRTFAVAANRRTCPCPGVRWLGVSRSAQSRCPLGLTASTVAA